MEATHSLQKSGEIPCAPKGMEGRLYPDPEVLKALTMLLKIVVVAT